jgi:hypothetical protein
MAVVIGGVFLASMAGVTGYALRALPAGALVPLNAGVPEHSVWLSRPAGLSAWAGIGAAAYAVGTALTVAVGANWMPSVRMVLLPCVMLIVLAAQVGAVICARRRCADTAALAQATVDGGSRQLVSYLP